MNSLQRTLQSRQLMAQKRKDKRMEQRIVEAFWERTGWYYLRALLRLLGMKGIAKRAFMKARVLRMRYVRFRGVQGYHLWEYEWMCSKRFVLIPDSTEQMKELDARIEQSRALAEQSK